MCVSMHLLTDVRHVHRLSLSPHAQITLACFPHGDVPDPAFRRHLNDNFDHIASALREVDGTRAFIIHDLKLLATTL